MDASTSCGRSPCSTASTDDQLRALADAGEEVRVRAGDVLFREGQPADHWWMLLEGEVELIRHVGHEDTVARHDGNPGRGPAGSGPGTRNGVYLATGRGRPPTAAASASPPRRSASWRTSGSPSACT